MISKDFFLALEELERTKGIKKSIFIEALETALVIAYKKEFGAGIFGYCEKQKAVRLLYRSLRRGAGRHAGRIYGNFR